MVSPQRIEHFDTTIVPLMTEDEARKCVARINGHMNSARVELLRLYERRGWQALGYASWRECVVAEFEQTQTHLYRQLTAAEIERRISPIGEIGTIPESQLRPMAALTPMEQPIAWQEANERSNGKPTARVIEAVVTEMIAPATKYNRLMDPPSTKAEDMSERKPRVNAGMYSSETPEWYTPGKIIDRVVSMFETIDLDPCSNSADWREAAVPATDYWTRADNGLVQPWHGNVYMNPPYGDEIPPWIDRMVAAYISGEISAAIALLPGRTDTDWFSPLFSYPICFVHGRLKFGNTSNSAPFPSVVVYLGPDVQTFHDWFHDLGPIMIPFT